MSCRFSRSETLRCPKTSRGIRSRRLVGDPQFVSCWSSRAPVSVSLQEAIIRSKLLRPHFSAPTRRVSPRKGTGLRRSLKPARVRVLGPLPRHRHDQRPNRSQLCRHQAVEWFGSIREASSRRLHRKRSLYRHPRPRPLTPNRRLRRGNIWPEGLVPAIAACWWWCGGAVHPMTPRCCADAFKMAN